MANVMFIDSREGDLKEYRNIILSGPKIYAEISEALSGQVPSRANATTFFKSLGMALEGIAGAMQVFRSAL
jgi:ornithine cyclodeaminase/alanine dehydrogenase-like protein (mu-crystallin family)